jgi:transcriptional regulator with XRE-family HTH domain
MPRLLGNKLRYLRLQHEMTQVELAQKLGLASHAHISHLESQRHEPSLDLVLQVADLFQVRMDYLLLDTIPIEQPLSYPGTKTFHQALHQRLFGTKLRYLRKHRNLLQMDLAQQLAATTQAHISFLESGRKSPSIDLVLQIAAIFEVTTDYLLRDDIPIATGDNNPAV